MSAEKVPSWRDYCKHYGSCRIGSNGRCFTPEDPAYVADMERRHPTNQQVDQ